MKLLAFGEDYNIQGFGDFIAGHINESTPDRFEKIIDYLENSHDTETVRRTLQLLDMLRLVDLIASGNSDDCASMHVITTSSENGFTAQYEPEGDAYGVFADKLCFMSEESSVFDGELFVEKSLSFDIILLSIAIHEVRHRLQHQNRIKLFTEDSSSSNHFVNEHIVYNKILFPYLNIVKGNEKIEFDTHLVQQHFISLANKKSTLSLDTILDCLFLEAGND